MDQASSPPSPESKATGTTTKLSVSQQQLLGYLQSISQRQPQQMTIFDMVGHEYKLHLSTMNDLISNAAEYQIVDEPILVAALIYVHRYLRMSQSLFTTQNAVPIYATALCIASKSFEDLPYNNSTFARLCGLATPIFNNMELHFLSAVRFRLAVDPAKVREMSDAFAYVEAPVKQSPTIVVSRRAILPQSSSISLSNPSPNTQKSTEKRS